ncbi:MAG: hypothetical protein SV775_13245 [Thermodesulfobacteriota bacterium]|nr:hypothetical protein [Thermodesulfobacteriota bacterium]
MDVSGIKKQLAGHVEKGYENFVKHKIPFSAVKINIPQQNHGKRQLEDIVNENFRGKRDVVFKDDHTYGILMQNTTIDEATAASKRLAEKLCQSGYFDKESPANQTLHASVDIIGCGKGNTAMQSTCFDFNKAVHSSPCQSPPDNLRYEVRTYMKCARLPKKDGPQNMRKIDIRI